MLLTVTLTGTPDEATAAALLADGLQTLYTEVYIYSFMDGSFRWLGGTVAFDTDGNAVTAAP